MLEVKLPAPLVFSLVLSNIVPVLTGWQETESVEFNRLNERSEATNVRLWEELIPKAHKDD
jgi:hypothetical protein